MIITSENNYRKLCDWIDEKNRILLVCGKSVENFKELNEKLLNSNIVRFSNFKPNPEYESVVDGVKVFKEEKCDAIIAVGGGSAMDVAKCIKLEISKTIPFLAIPTTAGTGSEATRFAVVYKKGIKQSYEDDCLVPNVVLLDPSLLKTLPDYQKKATMCDALCHAIESFWSVNSTDESKEYCKEAISMIIENMDEYFDNTDKGNERMLKAAHIAGKAINITKTTAGHAMCYKITTLYGVAHGHATMLCNRILYPWMIENTEKCIDKRGEKYLKNTLDEIGVTLGGSDAKSGSVILENIFKKLDFEIPKLSKSDIGELVETVNPDRLKNHPVAFGKEEIGTIYSSILG